MGFLLDWTEVVEVSDDISNTDKSLLDGWLVGKALWNDQIEEVVSQTTLL